MDIVGDDIHIEVVLLNIELTSVQQGNGKVQQKDRPKKVSKAPSLINTRAKGRK